MATAVNLERTSEAEEIAALIARSRAAQAQIANYTQEQVDELIRAMVWAVAKPGVAEMIARHTVEETQLGNYDGKYLKIFRKTRATLMDIIDDKSVGVIEEDPGAQHRQDRQAGRRDRRAVALDQPRGDPGDQGDLGGQGPQFDHRRAAPARQADQQADLRPDARGDRQDGRAGRPRARASTFPRSRRPTN